MRYLGRLLCVGVVMFGFVGCGAQSSSTASQPNTTPIDEVGNESSPTEQGLSPTEREPSPAEYEPSPTDSDRHEEQTARERTEDNYELCMGTIDQINGFGEVLEDVNQTYAQLEIGPGLVEIAISIEDLVEAYPQADASEAASAYASYFRGYGEEMEASIGNRSEYADVMNEMMTDTKSAELREDFLAACGGAAD